MTKEIYLVDLHANYLSIKSEIDAAIKNIIENSSYIMGQAVSDFEKEYARITDSKFCVTTSNGSSSLFLALKAIGFENGDEAITVPNTFIATSEAISLAGGKIKFVDVDKKTLLMDPESLEKGITQKTKVIIPVHLYGQMADMKRIKEIADKHGLYIIEDAAQAHLSEFNGRQPGYYSDVASYSFFPAKNLGCYGDGGCITTNNQEYSEKISKLRDHGRSSKYEHDMEGFNFRMDALQAAILSVKLKYLENWTVQRIKNAKIYNSFLKGTVASPYDENNRRITYYMYVIMSKERENIMKNLKANKISSAIHYPIPLHLQQAYENLNYRKGQFPNAENGCSKIVSLPMFPELNNEDIERICKCVIEVL